MPELILMRFDAPLLAFGAPIVDNFGVIQAYPGQALITGLLANALGYDHAQHRETTALQDRLRTASRADLPGVMVKDFQTVDLGQEHLDARLCGWTTRGTVEQRAGGSKDGTHIRHRDYWADAVHTVALTLEPSDESPTLERLADALQKPTRPLFFGRKTCLPAAPIYLATVSAASLYEALERAPLPRGRGLEAPQRLTAWWAGGHGPEGAGTRRLKVCDTRDWQNQIHVGQRFVVQGSVEVKEAL